MRTQKSLKNKDEIKNSGLSEKEAKENLVYFLNKSKVNYEKFLRTSKRIP
jgi:hypothetical protein